MENGAEDTHDLSYVKSQSGSPEPIPGRCGARIRKSDPPSFCQKPPIKGRMRCRLHGGTTPRGVAAPSYKGRGYSQDLPTRLLDRMEQGLNDPELTSLRSEIALLDARMGELFETLPEESVHVSLASIKDALNRASYVLDRPDAENREERMAAAISDIGEALSNITTETTAWREIYNVITLRRRAALAETKREEALEHTMLHQQALQFFSTLLGVIHDEVEDPELKQRLAVRIGERLNRPALVSGE